MIKSVEFFLKNIAMFAKQKTEFIIQNEQLVVESPSQVKIATSFFKNAICARCGACCHKGVTPLVLGNGDVEKIRELTDSSKAVFHGNDEHRFDTKDSIALTQFAEKLQEIPVTVNGDSSKSIWFREFDTKYRCGFDVLCEGDDVWGCKLHNYPEIQPIQCQLPWVRLSHVKSKVTLCKRPFGYAWAFGCQGYWGEEFDKEKFMSRDMWVVQKLVNYSAELGVDTYWKDIYDWLDDWFSLYKMGLVEIPTEDIIVFSTDRDINVKPKQTFF